MTTVQKLATPNSLRVYVKHACVFGAVLSRANRLPRARRHLCKGDYSKADVKKFIYDHARVSVNSS
jgi:hypothetical protein